MSSVEHPLDGSAITFGSPLGKGVVLMTIAGIGFIGYGIVLMTDAVFTSFIYGAIFWLLDLVAAGFESEMSTLAGISRGELDLMIMMGQLRVVVAGSLISTGIAVTALSWYGVRQQEGWAWATAVIATIIGLLIAFPFSYLGGFVHERAVHLGPIYVAGIVFGVGAVLALQGLRAS